MKAKVSGATLLLSCTSSGAEPPPFTCWKEQVNPSAREPGAGPVSCIPRVLLTRSSGTTEQSGATPVAAGVPALYVWLPPPPQPATTEGRSNMNTPHG